MSAHDRHLAGFQSYPVRAVCADCGEEWDDTYTEEYGAGWLVKNEECPKCGSSVIDTDPLDALDIEERRAEARGEDF